MKNFEFKFNPINTLCTEFDHPKLKKIQYAFLKKLQNILNIEDFHGFSNFLK